MPFYNFNIPFGSCTHSFLTPLRSPNERLTCQFMLSEISSTHFPKTYARTRDRALMRINIINITKDKNTIICYTNSMYIKHKEVRAMKQIFRNGLFIMLAAMLLGGLGMHTTGQAAARWKNICEPKVIAKKKVKLNLKKKNNISGYTIYRSELLRREPEKWSAKKKIATLSANKKSFTDKTTYKKWYKYELVAFKNKGKKKIRKYFDTQYVYMGVGQAQWDEYLSCDGITTPKSIELEYNVDSNGMMPERYDIYRSKTGKKYKKIASVKPPKKHWGAKYTDKNVVPGESYYYKVRASKVVGKKRIYGKYSSPILRSAVNSDGKYQAEFLTPETEMITSFDMVLTSDVGNATLYLDSDHLLDTYCQYEGRDNVPLRISHYSYDGKLWHEVTKESIVVKPGEKVYLRFMSEDKKEFLHPAFAAEGSYLYVSDMTYNRLTCTLRIDFKKKEGIVHVNGEYYH